MFFDTIFGRNFGRVHLGSAIVVCHGFPYEPGSVVDKGYSELADFLSRIAPTVVFDFSGCGNSRGKFGLEYWVEDLRRIAEKFDRVSIIGYSMGGLVAIRTSAELGNLDRLVSISAPLPEIFSEDRVEMMFENASRIMRTGSFEEFRREMEAIREFDLRRYARKVKGQKLVVHGTKDEVVPFECGEAIYREFQEPKYLIRVINGDHFLRRSPKVMSAVAEWLEGKIKEREINLSL
jgi:pimeloyl-ACP methyl ester carboxylesterase